MGLIIGIIVILLIVIGVCKLVIKGTDAWGVSKHGEEEWQKVKASVLEEDMKKKYNNYMFTCPMCGSKDVKKISDLNRAASVAALGAASSKIGKQYECDNCHHKW